MKSEVINKESGQTITSWERSNSRPGCQGTEGTTLGLQESAEEEMRPQRQTGSLRDLVSYE